MIGDLPIKDMIQGSIFVFLRGIWGFFIFYMFCTVGYSQIIRGTVFDEEGNSLAEVRVTIPLSGAVTFTDLDGNYILNVGSSRRCKVIFERLGYYKISRDVDVGDDETILNVVMYPDPISIPTVTVTAKPQKSLLEETSYSVTVMEGRELERYRGQNVVSSIEKVRGIATISSGVASQKPVIRGLGFQRVVLLENGMRHETQQWDEDDIPAIDAMTDQRIEIVRGPGSVLYGSDALGGVINIINNYYSDINIDSLIFGGKVSLNGFTNNRQVAGALLLNGSIFPVSYDAQLTLRKSGDISTPEKVLNNTSAEEINGHAGMGFSGEYGDFSFGLSHFNQIREILPESETEDDQNDEIKEPRQTTKHSRFNFSYHNISPLKWDLAGVYQINDVAEYEEKEDVRPRINLRLSTFSVDVKVHHKGTFGSLGTFGTNLQFQNNKTLGEESLLPDYRQSTIAAFLFEEFQKRYFNFSAGVRYDFRQLKTNYNENLNLSSQGKVFQSITASIGTLWHVSPQFTLTFNGGKGWRAPTAEELFIDGLEEGSLRYKVGNKNLRPEESYQIEVGSRVSLLHLRTSASVFYNHITRFIHLASTGKVDSTTFIEKFEHRQADAAIWGSEIDLNFSFLSVVNISGGLDLIWGKNLVTRTWLPLFPPHRFIVGIEYKPRLNSFIMNLHIRLDAKIYFDQKRVDWNEKATPGYTLFDLMIGFDLSIFKNPVYVDINICNLFNKAYRDHLSLYKNFVLNPGIDAVLKISVPFKLIR